MFLYKLQENELTEVKEYSCVRYFYDNSVNGKMNECYLHRLNLLCVYAIVLQTSHEDTQVPIVV